MIATLLCGVCFADNGDGVKRDYWDEEAGIYYDEEGNPHPIENADEMPPEDENDPTGGQERTPAVENNIPQNADGSITVESGQLPIGEPEEEEAGLTVEEWNARMAKAMSRTGVTTGTVYIDESGNAVPATIEKLGLGRSTIVLNGEKMTVPTCCLSWDSEVSADQALAVVGVAKQGYAIMRDKSSSKAFIMDHVTTGQVVRVISSGDNWTLVDHDGMRGYVRTTSLNFYSNTPREYKTGWISYKGRMKGTATINIRANPKNGSRILGDYVLGTELTIFSEQDKWYEIEVDGWHCYILKEYVTLNTEA